jgi:AcrR family transcriptional regulator
MTKHSCLPCPCPKAVAIQCGKRRQSCKCTHWYTFETGGRTQRQTAEVRTRIVEAAYESFWRLGFRRSSVDSIAARAGLTKRTVYAYFRSKDDLLAAVLQRYEALAARRLEHIGSRLPADRTGLINSFFDQLSGWTSTTPRWSGSGFTRLVVN